MSSWRIGVLDVAVDTTECESKVMGSISLCIRFMGFEMCNA
jgi:hypothetical protein